VGWLGGEFLLWLWWRADEQGGEFDLPASGRDGEERLLSLMIDEELVLGGEPPKDGAGGCGVTALRLGAPAESGEAAAALLSGKMPVRARLLLAQGERQWRFVLDAATLDVRSLKLPEAEDAETAEDELVERLVAVAEARGFVEGLFGLFLGRRLGPQWVLEDAPGIRTWIQQKTEKRRLVGV
jgi:hypothetical protein